MKLEEPFYRLPLRFDGARMLREVNGFDEGDWTRHPTGFAGNTALILISVNGEPNDEFSIAGPMRPTPLLNRCPYIRQVLASLNAPLSRTRVMRLAPGARVPRHRDSSYHWHRRIRVHVPIVTDPVVRFVCGGDARHMAAGEAWVFDNSRMHAVENPSSQPRLHLVADTRGSADFSDLLEKADSGEQAPNPAATEPLTYQPDIEAVVDIEPYRFEVLSPEELDHLLGEVRHALAGARSGPEAAEIENELGGLQKEWKLVFEAHGHDRSGRDEYRRLVRQIRETVRPFRKSLPPDASYAASIISTMLARTNRRKPESDRVDRSRRQGSRRGFIASSHVTIDRDVGSDSPVVRLHGQPVQLPEPLYETLRAFRHPATLTEACGRISREASLHEEQIDRSFRKLLAMRLVTPTHGGRQRDARSLASGERS